LYHNTIKALEASRIVVLTPVTTYDAMHACLTPDAGRYSKFSGVQPGHGLAGPVVGDAEPVFANGFTKINERNIVACEGGNILIRIGNRDGGIAGGVNDKSRWRIFGHLRASLYGRLIHRQTSPQDKEGSEDRDENSPAR
jgi:hypothetical protein